jgi:hypothetical protein
VELIANHTSCTLLQSLLAIGIFLQLPVSIGRLLYIMNINGTQGFKWIEFVISTFDEIGLSFMYPDQ